MTESSIWVPFKETEFDEKIENRVLVGLKLYSEIYQNFRIFEKVLGHRVRH